METHFALAGRVGERQLKKDIEFVSKNFLVDGLMGAVNGLLAVLNMHRQILAVNDSFLEMLGIHNADEVLGLRPGEAFDCIYAHDPPDGCGTTEFCSTCGAAIAMVLSFGRDKTVERKCAIKVKKKGQEKEEDLFLRVICQPIHFKQERFFLLFLQDITEAQKWEALGKVFLHDIANIVSGLLGTSELLAFENREDSDKLARMIYQLSLRLTKEIDIQKYLTQPEAYFYQSSVQRLSVAEIFQSLKDVFSNHPVAKGKYLQLQESISDITFMTDYALLMRVLCNMITNAFEGTEDGGGVKCWVEQQHNRISFCVWNTQYISEDISRRIFQKNISTKEETGRGLGTYSMKLFGEEFLGGKVNFTTSESGGTVFRFTFST